MSGIEKFVGMSQYVTAHEKIYEGDRVVFTFPNGRGASVIRHKGSYGGHAGLWELAVLDRTGELDYSTPITGDVLGYLTPAEVVGTLELIRDLPEAMESPIVQKFDPASTPILSLALSSAPALAQSGDVQTAWRLLDYIAVDYREAIADGRIINQLEYDEMVEFSASVSERLAALPAHPQRDALVAGAERTWSRHRRAVAVVKAGVFCVVKVTVYIFGLDLLQVMPPQAEAVLGQHGDAAALHRHVEGPADARAAFGTERRPGWSPTYGLRVFGWTHAYTVPYALAILSEWKPDRTSGRREALARISRSASDSISACRNRTALRPKPVTHTVKGTRSKMMSRVARDMRGFRTTPVAVLGLSANDIRCR